MQLGFQFNVDSCNTPIVIGFICSMVMVVVLLNCVKVRRKTNRGKEKKPILREDIKLIEQKRDGE